MDETGKDGQHVSLEEQCVSQPTVNGFPIDARVADLPDDHSKLLDMGLEEHFRG